MPTDELLPTRIVAELLGVHVRTVHKMVQSGTLCPAVVAPGYRGDFLFNPSVVEALAVQRECDRFVAR